QGLLGLWPGGEPPHAAGHRAIRPRAGARPTGGIARRAVCAERQRMTPPRTGRQRTAVGAPGPPPGRCAAAADGVQGDGEGPMRAKRAGWRPRSIIAALALTVIITGCGAGQAAPAAPGADAVAGPQAAPAVP